VGSGTDARLSSPTISGTVKKAGAPVSGAVLQCIRQSTNTIVGTQTSAADGTFKFSGLPAPAPEKYHITVRYEEAGVKYSDDSQFDVEPGESS